MDLLVTVEYDSREAVELLLDVGSTCDSGSSKPVWLPDVAPMPAPTGLIPHELGSELLSMFNSLRLSFSRFTMGEFALRFFESGLLIILCSQKAFLFFLRFLSKTLLFSCAYITNKIFLLKP